jgi:hypothetical protein
MIRQLGKRDDAPPVIEIVEIEITDPRELEEARLQREQFDRNSAWLQQHIQEIYAPANRGKIVCIAGQEAFFGETVKEVVERARAAHPHDKGYFTRYIPRRKMTWIYAN